MIRAIEKQSTAELRADRQDGSFHVVTRQDDMVAGLQFICPCGCGNESWITLGSETGGWMMTGYPDRVTLSPSVHQTGLPCGWHGWLRNGDWRLA